MHSKPIAWAIKNSPKDLTGLLVLHEGKDGNKGKGRGTIVRVENGRVIVAFDTGGPESRFNADFADSWLRLVGGEDLKDAVKTDADAKVGALLRAQEEALREEETRAAAIQQAAAREAEAAARDRVLKRRKHQLEQIFNGWRMSAHLQSYSSHCWMDSCRRPLNAAFHRSCRWCGWVVCPCGACGSGWSSLETGQSCPVHTCDPTESTIDDELRRIFDEIVVPADAQPSDYTLKLSNWGKSGVGTKMTVKQGVPVRSVISIEFRGETVVAQGSVSDDWKAAHD